MLWAQASPPRYRSGSGGASEDEDGAKEGTYLTISVNTVAGEGPTTWPAPGDVLSPWQGVVVERKSPGSGATQVTFNAEGRTIGTRTIVGSNAATSNAPTAARMGPLKLTVEDAEGQQVARDEAAVLTFHSAAEGAWDAHDASKLTPLTNEYAVLGPVGTLRDGTSGIKAVESRPLPSGTENDIITVPLALQTEGAVQGTATIRPWPLGIGPRSLGDNICRHQRNRHAR